jgi:hypothetical protein
VIISSLTILVEVGIDSRLFWCFIQTCIKVWQCKSRHMYVVRMQDGAHHLHWGEENPIRRDVVKTKGATRKVILVPL